MTRVSMSIGVLALLAAAAAVHGGSSDRTHALCLGDSSYVSGMNIEDFVTLRKSRTGDFLWFRRDGRQYVVTDAATLDAARAALGPVRELEVEMKAVEDRLRPYEEREEAIDREEEQVEDARDALEDREDASAEAEMRKLDERQREIDARRRTLESERRQVEVEERRLEAREREVDRAVEAAINRLADEAVQRGLAERIR